MAETAQSIIDDALLELTVLESESVTDSFDMQRGIRTLNRMLNEWYAQGVNLGFTELTNPSNLVTVPPGAVSGIVYNLAIRLASGFQIAPPVTLVKSANDGYKAILDIGFEVGKACFPNNLPTGSGNWEALGTYNNQNFFDNPCEDWHECGNHNDKNCNEDDFL